MEKTVIELFAGVGGFRVGLNSINSIDFETGLAKEEKKWNFVWANQWEPSTKVQHAFDCYRTRFGDGEVSNQDISKFAKNDIPNHSLLVGGFPCQDYSVARTKSNEKGIEGKKGVLFWDIAETLKVKGTPFFLLENVDRLLKTPAVQRGRDFGIMLRSLYDLGYDLEWRVINAADYGRAQRRRRVFIFGWKNDLKYSKQYDEQSVLEYLEKNSLFARTFPIQTVKEKISKEVDLVRFSDTVEMTEHFEFGFENTGMMVNGKIITFKSIPVVEPPITLGNILDDETDKMDFILTQNQIEKFEYLKGGKKIPRIKPNGEKYFYSEGSMSPTDVLDLPGRTMLTSEGTVNRSSHLVVDVDTGEKRFITPIEAERLQDFPDNWTDTGMPVRRRYFMMGNALVTGIITKLSENLFHIIDNE